MKYQGGCHCGNLRIEFETAISPAAIELRACQCTFCRKHGSRAVTDPAGHLAIGVERGDHLERCLRFANGRVPDLQDLRRLRGGGDNR